MINEKPLTDMSRISCVNINGKEYISLNEVFAIIEGYQRFRPDSIETTSYIGDAINYTHKTGRTLNFDLRHEYLKGD